MKEAKLLAHMMLRGAGTTDWERFEQGDSAIHIRRRLNTEEMKLLFQVNAACPVFTHGKACNFVLTGE